MAVFGRLTKEQLEVALVVAQEYEDACITLGVKPSIEGLQNTLGNVIHEHNKKEGKLEEI